MRQLNQGLGLALGLNLISSHAALSGSPGATSNKIPLGQSAALGPARGADIRMEKPVTDSSGQCTTVMLGNQRMHQVKRCRTAGAGDAIPIHHIKVAFHQKAGRNL